MWMTGKGICFCFFLFFVLFLFLFFFCLYFSRGRRPLSSTCCYGFLCEGEGGESCLVDELDKLLWTTVEHGQLSSSTLVPPPSRSGAVTSVQTGDPGATVPFVQLVQWDTDLFTVSLPFLTSLVHTAAVVTVIDTLAHLPVCCTLFSPPQPTTTHIR